MVGVKTLLIGCVLAGFTLFGGSALAQTYEAYIWNGMCSDCAATDTPASAVLELQNYAPGDALRSSNFVSFSYQSTLYTLSFAADSFAALSGVLPTAGSNVDMAVSLTGLTDTATSLGYFSFVTNGDGSWDLALNGTSFDRHGPLDGGLAGWYHDTSNWQLRAFGGGGGSGGYCVSPVPEPKTFTMLLSGLGLIALVMWRRRQASPDTSDRL